MLCAKRFSIGLLCFGMVLICAAVPALAAPKAELPATAFDFGLVGESRDNVHPFIIKNTGDADLVIERIATDCGCTTTKYDRVIAPGAEGTVYVTLNTNGYRGHTITRKIKIYFNDKSGEPATLTVSANVSDVVTVTPPRVSFTGYTGEDLVSVVTITPMEQFPFKALSAEARFNNNISYELTEDVKDGRPVYLLTVSNTKENAGRYFDEIIIKTDNATVGDIAVRVNASILPRGSEIQ